MTKYINACELFLFIQIVPTIIRDITLLNVDAVLIAANTGMFHFGDMASKKMKSYEWS